MDPDLSKRHERVSDLFALPAGAEGSRRLRLSDELGQGDLDVLGCLKALRKLGYRHGLSLEYEENPEDPIADIAACLQTVRAAVLEIA